MTKRKKREKLEWMARIAVDELKREARWNLQAFVGAAAKEYPDCYYKNLRDWALKQIAIDAIEQGILSGHRNRHHSIVEFLESDVLER